MSDDGKKQTLAEQSEKAKVPKLSFKSFMIPRRVLKGHFGKIYAVAWVLIQDALSLHHKMVN